MTRCLALLVVAFFAGITPASAQILIESHTVQALVLCEGGKSYAPGDTGAPDRIARSFDGKGSVITFRTCQDADGNTHYFIRKPRPNRNGVCRVVEDEVFAGGADDHVQVDILYDGTASDWFFDLPGWKPWPPQDWTAMHYAPRSRMLAFVTATAASCPRTDDRRYIPAVATDGMLKTFFEAWRPATRSPDGFERFFAKVPVLPTPLFERLGTSGVLPGLRSAIFDRREDIDSVDCDISGLGMAGDCTAWIGIYSLSFDVTDHGLVITGVRENPVT